MTAGFFFSAATVLLSLEVGFIYMAPDSGSACEGVQLGDEYRFNLPIGFIKPECDVSLMIEGINSAMYKGGKAPSHFLTPVTHAAMNYFILKNCSKSIVLERECKNESDRIEHCICSNYSNTNTSQLTKLDGTEHNSTDTSTVYRRYDVTVAVFGVSALVILAIVVIASKKWSIKRMRNLFRRTHQDEDLPAKSPLPTSFV